MFAVVSWGWKLRTHDDYSAAFLEVSNAESDVFSYLVEVSGLNPKTDFQEARLQSIDLQGSNLEDFNFSLADLRGAKWHGVLTEPYSVFRSLRGDGEDNVSGGDFPNLAAICVSKANWGERFLAFKLLVDNWGENIETSEVLIRILEKDKGTYLRLCAFVYFCASYNKDAKMKSYCVEMAKAGRSQVNIFRLKTLRKAVRDYSKFFERGNFARRYPGDIDKEVFQMVQKSIDAVEDREPDQRFL
ncbi:MAG: pentapeptide repeat-containing protein [Vibrio splendidus]